MSVVPPAVKATTIFTVLAGQAGAWAWTAVLMSAAAQAATGAGDWDMLLWVNEHAAFKRTALEITQKGALIGRPLTIEVEARLGQTTRTRLRQIVILTGRAASPYALKERY